MAFFTDADQFYTCTKALFEHIEEEDPGAADDILASRLVIRIQCTEPEVEFTIQGRQRPVKTTFGPSPQRPTMEIKLPADALHHIMLGELSLKRALANGKLQVRGPVMKITALADLFYRLQAHYPQVLHEQGLLLG